MDYIDRIVAVRTDADDSIRFLAKELGISYSQWATYERRIHEMPIHYLIKFCEYYGVSADYILGFGRDMKWPR